MTDGARDSDSVPAAPAAEGERDARHTESRREHLQDLILQSDVRIAGAERRIEDHHQLWGKIAADSRQRRIHVELEHNLLDALKLLHTHRAMVLHELHGDGIPRQLFAGSRSREDLSLEKAERTWQTCLERASGWPLEPAVTARLYELSTWLTATADLPSILYQVLDATIELQGADFGNIQLFDSATRTLKIVAHRGFNQDFLDYFASVDAGDRSACGLALRSGARIIIEDVNTNTEFAVHRGIAAAAGFRGVQSTPLLDRNSGQAIGMLSTHFREPYRPAENELQLTDFYARQAADVIAFRLAERALRENESRLSMMLERVPGAVGIFDCEGRFVLRGGSLRKLWGDTLPSRDAASRRCWQGFAANGELLAASQYPDARALRGETVSPGLNFMHTAGDGHETWIRVSAAPLRNEGGEIIGGMTILENVDAEKRAEQRLAKSEAWLQAAIDPVKLGRYTWNLQTKALQWDDTMRAMWGLPAGAPVDHELWRAAVHPEDLARVEAAIERGLDPEGDGVCDVDYRVIGKADGVERRIATRGKANFQNNLPLCVHGLALDITDRTAENLL